MIPAVNDLDIALLRTNWPGGTVAIDLPIQEHVHLLLRYEPDVRLPEKRNIPNGSLNSEFKPWFSVCKIEFKHKICQRPTTLIAVEDVLPCATRPIAIVCFYLFRKDSV